MAATVTLADLAAAAAAFSPRLVGSDVAVGDLHHDSRTVLPGHGFVAIPGSQADGHDHVADAVARGAAAVVVERRVETATPMLIVADTRRALPALAAAVHHHPSRELAVVGVTGTNGKTTVTHMLESIVRASGRAAGVIGTVGSRIDAAAFSQARTTPEATDLQRLLRTMADAAVEVVALEVSSHALVLGRADAIDFAVAAFTNLSQDHLDFHGSLEAYVEAKSRLFAAGRARRAVIWTDDPVGARIAAESPLPVTSVGWSDGTDIRGEVAALDRTHGVVEAHTPDGRVRLEVPLPGRFNLANALLALGCARAIGVDNEAAAAGLGTLGPVPGRFELVDAGQECTIVVDYAHTPEAIERIVDAARDLVSGRVIVVVGAGGDRDRHKRPEMGRAAAAADIAVITSDNPRSEDPEAIIAAVAAGAHLGSAELLVEAERAVAIERAIALAEADDIVLILGKGHERVQELGDRTIPFDDRVVAAAAAGSGVAS